MKTKIFSSLLALAFLFFSCEPIEERDELSSSVGIPQIELQATNTTDGGNKIELLMNTPGVTGHWDYIINKGYTNHLEVVLPVTGAFDFTYKGSNGNELFEKKVSVTIDKLDTEVDPEWSALLGSNAAAGKTWVLATDRPPNMEPYAGDDRVGLFSHMSSDVNWLEVWWNAGECCPPVDVNAEMTFDLNGAPNYTYTNGEEVKTGQFILDPATGELTINGADLVGAYGAPGQIEDTKGGVYKLMKMTETEMILYQVHNTGWTWIFKPKGHTYE